MTGWLTSLRDRPIAERERRTAVAVVAVLLAASAILLAAIRPAGHPNDDPAPHGPVAPAVRASRPPMPTSGAGRARPVTVRTARGFLAGYLAYLYGHAPAGAVKSATPALARSLRAHPPIGSPGMRARHPRVLALHVVPAPAGLIGVSAVVNDGELASYPVVLLLASERGRLLVSAVQGA
jgi:hypothetical protein